MSIPVGAKRLLSFISQYEAPNGYVDYFRGVKFPPPRPLTEMTINQVLDWQKAANPPGLGTAAAGRYQIIEPTLKGLVRNLGLTGDELFNEEMQDRMAFSLLEGRGWGKFIRGSITAEQFADNVAKEWAALPLTTGPRRGLTAYPPNNRALCSVEEYLEAIWQARQDHMDNWPKPTPKPAQDSGVSVWSLVRRFLSLIIKILRQRQ